jgi:glycosyltransferase involved in cell wall biosynthesis
VKVVHVAVDAHNLVRDDRGIGRYARAVLTRAAREPDFRWTLVVRDLFPRRGALLAAIGADPDDGLVAVRRRVPADTDVVWFPWNGTFLRSAAPSVATVHDAAPFAFPHPDPKVRATEQGPFLTTAATARRILVQSRFTASEVTRWLGVEPERIVVTPLAADEVFTPTKPAAAGAPTRPEPAPRGVTLAGAAPAAWELPEALRGKRYVLNVGAHDERKNTGTLIAAYERAFPNGEVALAFTRKPPRLPRGGVVVELPNDAALATLYRGAALVALPSPYEGFGLPLLEAMACGTPTIAARAGALPEVGDDAAAWVDDPFDVDAWASALRELLADDEARSRLAARGPTQAASFSWERCTARTLAVLREVAGG